MARTYDFAVLRLAPDAARGEVVNVGLVIFKEDGVDVRVGDVLTRARAVYRDFGTEALDDTVAFMKEAGAVSLPAADRHRVLSRIGLFALGDLGYFTVSDTPNETYEDNVARLLEIFVATPRRKRAPLRASRLMTEVRHMFREHKLLAAVGDAAAINEHKIVPEWPIPSHPILKVDLALKNGIMRVAQVCDLSAGSEANLPPAVMAGLFAMEVAKVDAQAEKRVFAYRAEKGSKRVDEVLKLADLQATEIIDLGNPAESKKFYGDWISAAEQAQNAA